MVKPSFETTDTLVPVLSREQIEQIAIDILNDYDSGYLSRPQPLDIDRFLERYLGVNMDYKFLAHRRLYLGMTVFADCSKVPVFNSVKRKAEYISCKAGTVLLDISLLDDSQKHSYAFTGAHEGSHVILHGDYYRNLLASSDNKDAFVRCRDDTRRSGRTCRTDKEWLEWQADALASSLLMPLPAVQFAVSRAKLRSVSVNYAQEAIQRDFDVSSTAAAHRFEELQRLGLLTDVELPEEEELLPF